MKVLVSAGESSGDLYAARLVEVLRARFPGAEFFGCTGPRMRQAGVHTVVDSASLAVVGLVEVISHLPRIYGEYRKLCRAIEREKPDLAILTDSPDFHLRVARRLKKCSVPVVYLVAPQVWAWRKGRLPAMKRRIDRLLCIFPFEEAFFRSHGIEADYIGHPLARLVKRSMSREEFFRRYGLDPGRPVVALLPGSRRGEVARHLPALCDAAERLRGAHPGAQFVLAAPAGFGVAQNLTNYRERFSRLPIQVIEGQTWDVLVSAEVCLAASGTVTIEAALLGVPMVTFYKVSALSWYLGKLLVRTPFYSMVNLVAGRKVVVELMQNECTGERLAEEASRLLASSSERARMRHELARVAGLLSGGHNPMEYAASRIEAMWKKETVHV